MQDLCSTTPAQEARATVRVDHADYTASTRQHQLVSYHQTSGILSSLKKLYLPRKSSTS